MYSYDFVMFNLVQPELLLLGIVRYSIFYPYRYSPLGIMSLICSALLDIEDLGRAVVSVGLLMVIVVTGCLLHQFVVLPALMAIICRRNPYTYFIGIFDGYLAGIASLSR